VRVLVVGSGGREHALVQALVADPDVEEVVAAPGNPGIAEHAKSVPVDPLDGVAVAVLAEDHDCDLVVIGPEAPLVAGVADAVRGRGIACFGPSAEAARIEGSKAFAKEVMAGAGIRTAHAHVFTAGQLAAAQDHLCAVAPPYVVKYDGLAGGKGVTVTRDLGEAQAAVAASLSRPDDRVVVEDFLEGPEFSLFAVTDGHTVVPLIPAQDLKRLQDGDVGPNTGGMGAYAPLPWADADLLSVVAEEVLVPAVAELHRRGAPFIGLLYAGLALTAEGPAVVEFNARFGDPETQSLLALLDTPLAGLLFAAARGRLAQHPALSWRSATAVTVVVAAAGYPQQPRSGDPIGGLAAAAAVPNVSVFHAGTALVGGRLVSAGGRVLDVTAVGTDLGRARESAYQAVDRIELAGMQVRRDVALAATGGDE